MKVTGTTGTTEGKGGEVAVLTEEGDRIHVEITEQELVSTPQAMLLFPNLYLRSVGIDPTRPYRWWRDAVTYTVNITQEKG